MIPRRIGFAFLFWATLVFSQFQIPDREIQYRKGDWMSYPVTRFATSVDMDQNTIYVGTTGGIMRWDFYRREWKAPYTRSDGLDSDNIRLLAFDFNTGYLWCVTDGGLNVRLPDSEQWRHISYNDIGVNRVTSLGVGRKYVWVQSQDIFMKTDHTGDNFFAASVDDARQDDVRWQGKMKAASDGTLPNLFMDNAYLFSPAGYILDRDLRKWDVTGSLQDEFRNLWIITWGLGLGWADLNTLRLELMPFGLYTPDVQAMAWDADGMWIGGLHPDKETGGITHWNIEKGEWNYYEARYTSRLRSDEVNYIAPDTDCVWFATMDGLARYDKRKDYWMTFGVHQNLWSDEVNCVALEDRVLWVGTQYGMNRILLPELIVEKMHDPRLNNRCINDVQTDGDLVWASTDRGIFRYTRSKNEWVYLKGYPGMLVQEATAASVFGDEVWFGTDDGVEMFNKKTGEWIGFSKNQYPTGGLINIVAADSDVVWFGTEGSGVLKYLKSENRWCVFTTEDGLLDNAVRDILLDGDYVWFGTGKGLTRFYWNAPYRRD